ncbi:MAG: TonB-dependent receptor, partial [Pseudomonadota bacterium]
DEEFIWSYEIGSKSRLLDDRVELNTAAFYYDYTDQQLSQVTNLATQTTNAGSSTIWGIEAEFKALLTDNFQLDGTLAYLNTEFDEFCTNDTRDLTRPIDNVNCPGTPNLAGNELPRSPDVQANLAATYSQEVMTNIDGFARFEWQYTGDQFFSVFNRENIAQDAFSVFNASAGVGDADGRWSLRVWGRNLFDEEYFSNVFESGVLDNVVVPQGFVAPPRTFGVTLTAAY